MKAEFGVEMLNSLKDDLKNKMSLKRWTHTLGVERMAMRLGEIYCEDSISLLCAAALLHDVTKEYTKEEHIEICKAHGVELSEDELNAPATLHGITASLIIPERYEDFADEELINAVRYHTTGRENMTLCERLIYLADYIDETRTFDDCVVLREEFFSAHPEKMSEKEKYNHLNRVLLHSFDLTIADLLSRGKVLSQSSVKARNSIIIEIENNR